MSNLVATNPSETQSRPRIAFFGLGRMGLPMARNLLKAGYDVRGIDPAAPARAAFSQAGGRSASAPEAVSGAEIVITMLPDGKAVRSALLDGDPAVADSMAQGAVVVEMSSSSPIDTLALGEKLKARGIELVDAPVSGGVKKAEAATLAIMAGGAPEPLAKARPILQALGSQVFETGPLGSGHAMKALNNYVSAAGLAAACEALLVGGRLGLDPSLMVDVLNASTGRNNSTENKMKPFVLSGAFDSGFAIDLMAKDLATADDLARHLGVVAPLSSCCRELWRRAADGLEPGADHTAIFRFLERLHETAP